MPRYEQSKPELLTCGLIQNCAKTLSLHISQITNQSHGFSFILYISLDHYYSCMNIKAAVYCCSLSGAHFELLCIKLQTITFIRNDDVDSFLD